MNVIVVGAGIAGLSCATALQANGHSVTIFDKSRGPAGRMSTRRTEIGQWDHGAQYFTARDPRFQKELARWHSAGTVAPWRPRLIVIGDQLEHTLDGNLVRYVGTPRMTSPAKWLSESLSLKLGLIISSLIPSERGWQVKTLENGVIDDHFDALIIAVPAPQASNLLEEIAHPFLPLVQKVTMVGCWTLMLHYSQKLDLEFDAAFVNTGPLRWIARDSSKPGRTQYETWVLQASAAWSELHMESSAAEVIPQLLDAFNVLGGTPPDSCLAHRWRYADTLLAQKDRFLWDNDCKLGVCGDWINGGKVEGAWLSGLELAQSMMCHEAV